MRQGVVFGRSLLGYRVENGKLYLVEEEAELVRLIFYKYLQEGKGVHTIARELTETYPMGDKTKWSTTAILRILRNEKYVGDLCQKKTYTKSYLDHKKHYNRGQEEMIYIKDHHPEIAIIKRDIWDATQEELLHRSQSLEQKKKYSNRYWASGKIFCGICGERFISRSKHTKHGVYQAWSCSNHVKSTSFRTATCDTSQWISDRSLKQILLFLLSVLIGDKATLKETIFRNIKEQNYKETTKPIDRIQDKIDRLTQKKLRLIDMCLSEEISKQDFTIKKEQIESEISVLSNELANILQPLDSNNQTEFILAEIDRILSFQHEDIDALLGTVTQQITVYDNHIVEVILHHLPFRFQLHYHSTGKNKTYRTEILDFHPIKKGC